MTNERVIRRYSRSKDMSWKRSQSGKMGTKQLVSSTWQPTCTLLVGHQEVPGRAQCEVFGAFAILPLLVTPQLFLVSATKKCSKRTTICMHQGSHCRTNESTDRAIGEWFPGMFPKA
jgi:hypothetical protein